MLLCLHLLEQEIRPDFIVGIIIAFFLGIIHVSGGGNIYKKFGKENGSIPVKNWKLL